MGLLFIIIGFLGFTGLILINLLNNILENLSQIMKKLDIDPE